MKCIPHIDADFLYDYWYRKMPVNNIELRKIQIKIWCKYKMGSTEFRDTADKEKILLVFNELENINKSYARNKKRRRSRNYLGKGR